ncbi:hypothetical protein ACFVU2_21140 [Leifsonia sp. NPDC058194]|uniref:hypothetical protein n=1 Tax=Leifsonia sp. NPDC058194 TaxID=3346374 RepID=UPI0036D86D11
MSDIPKRFPPPLARHTTDSNGLNRPVMEPPFVECGQTVTLRGVGLVTCIRRKGHPVAMNYGHSNGYEEWLFDSADTPTGGDTAHE